MNTPNEPSENEWLDAAIRRALEVEADTDQLASLHRFWHRRSRSMEIRRRIVRALPLVAAVLAIVVTSLVMRRPAQVPLEAGRSPVPSQPVAPSEHQEEPSDSQPIDFQPVPAGRPPTHFERLVFAARSGRGSSATSAMAVSDAMAQLLDDSVSEVRQQLSSRMLDPRRLETALLRRLPRATASERSRLVRGLALCGTDRSIPALLRLARRNDDRDEVVAAVEQIVGPTRLAGIVPLVTGVSLREALMRRLLDNGTDEARIAFLSLVRKEPTREAALQLAKSEFVDLVEPLLALLDHERSDVRYSAAVVLGHLNGPEVTRSLIARITEQPSDSTEAWIALLACQGDMAQEFLAYAAHRPQLLGHYNTALVRRAQQIP